jgi:hypothetical protein
MQAGRPPQMLISLFKEAMAHFEEAEKIHPAGNDDAVLRWNRCVRLLEKLPPVEESEEPGDFADHDSAPLEFIRRSAKTG